MSYKRVAMSANHPVRIWGDLSAIYRDRDYNSGASHATDLLAVSTINASSYLWQPWIALVNGSLSFSLDREESTEQATRQNQYINGRFQFNLFPVSRFPFLFYASKNRNELDDVIFGRTITNTIIGIRQQYTSLDGRQFYKGNIEHQMRSDVDQESFINNAFDFTAQNKMKDNIVYGDIAYSNTEKPNKDDATNYALTGRHSYTGSRNLVLENLLSITQTHIDFINDSSDTKNNQISSFLSWRPAKRSDLNITANFRVSDLKQLFNQRRPNMPGNGISRNERTTININQGLIYNYTPRITLTESINGTQIKTGNNTQFTGSEGGGINYNSKSIIALNSSYNWYAGTNFNHLHGDYIADEITIKGLLGHSLSKDIYLTPDIKLQSSFNQSAGYDIREDKDNASSLNHSVSINWSKSRFSNSSSVRFMATDTRNRDIEKSHFQLFNLQISNDYRINRHTHVLANLTFQKSRVTTKQKTTDFLYGNGQLNYINNRFLNTSGLSFRSELRFSKKVSDNQNDITTADSSYYDNSWKNALAYRIGLFETRLNLDYVNNQGAYERVIKLQLTRSFGDL